MRSARSRAPRNGRSGSPPSRSRSSRPGLPRPDSPGTRCLWSLICSPPSWTAATPPSPAAWNKRSAAPHANSPTTPAKPRRPASGAPDDNRLSRHTAHPRHRNTRAPRRQPRSGRAPTRTRRDIRDHRDGIESDAAGHSGHLSTTSPSTGAVTAGPDANTLSSAVSQTTGVDDPSPPALLHQRHPSEGYEHGAQCQDGQHLQPGACGDDAVPSLLKLPGIRREFSSLGGGGKPGIDGGTDPAVDDEPAG